MIRTAITAWACASLLFAAGALARVLPSGEGSRPGAEAAFPAHAALGSDTVADASTSEGGTSAARDVAPTTKDDTFAAKGARSASKGGKAALKGERSASKGDKSEAKGARSASRAKAARPRAGAVTGKISYYGRRVAGRKTASGERYDPSGLTMAHRTLPFGTRVRVTNVKNKRSVVLRVNDRGPWKRGRTADVSLAAARKLGMLKPGVVTARLEVLSRPRSGKGQGQTEGARSRSTGSKSPRAEHVAAR